MKNIINSKFQDRSIQEIADKTFAMTHGGVFHADEIFCLSFLNEIRNLTYTQKFGRSSVIRTTDNYRAQVAASDPSYIVFDIGFGEFDHHDFNVKEYREEIADRMHADKTIFIKPYASFGKMWRAYGIDFIRHMYAKTYKDNASTALCEKFAKYFDVNFISPIDGKDCGAYNAKSNISEVIHAMNSQGNNPESLNKIFWESAYPWIQFAFRSMVSNTIKDINLYKMLMQAVESRNKSENWIILAEYTHTNDLNSIDPGIDYIIYPSVREPGKWVAGCIADQKKLLKKPFFDQSKYDGISFIHNSGFMAVGESLEAVVNACKQNNTRYQ